MAGNGLFMFCRHRGTIWSQTQRGHVGPNSNTRTRTTRPPKLAKLVLVPQFHLDPILAVANASTDHRVVVPVVTTTLPSVQPVHPEMALALTTRRTHPRPPVDYLTVLPTVISRIASKPSTPVSLHAYTPAPTHSCTTSHFPWLKSCLIQFMHILRAPQNYLESVQNMQKAWRLKFSNCIFLCILPISNYTCETPTLYMFVFYFSMVRPNPNI